MMKAIYLSGFALVIASAMMPASAALSDYANLVMIGSIVAGSCSIDTSSQGQKITIGDFPAGGFSAVGDVTPAKSFSIKIVNCSQQFSNSTITFSGTQVSGTGLLALSDVSGAGNMASGVGVEILDSAMNPVDLNKSLSIGTLKTGATNTLNYSLRYKATEIPVKAGNASAIMYFDVSYK
ncbi:TPA: fimbrial protein [Enterobacter chengduensis]|nr:fimbrial protein [Enterobacter chengduensis]